MGKIVTVSSGGIVIPKQESITIGFDRGPNGDISPEMTLNVSKPMAVLELASLLMAVTSNAVAQAGTAYEGRAPAEKGKV